MMNAIPSIIPASRAPRMWRIFHRAPVIRRRAGSSSGHQTRMPVATNVMCWSAWSAGEAVAASNKGPRCQP